MLKWLMLLAVCNTCLLVKAQEVVHAGIATFDYTGCVPVKIQFADNSTGSPTSWLWDFGDGHTSTQPSPSFTYTVPGSYRVKLVVKNAVSGDSAYKDVVISGARADFTYNYSNACNTPVTINFFATNPLNRIMYRWDFGDSQKAIFINPEHTYNDTGMYLVRLTTISPDGCQDSTTKTIQTGGSTVDFKAPALICENEKVTFEDTSTPLPLSATWKVNNVVVQQSVGNFTYEFKSSGSYTVQLTENFGTCSNTATKQVDVFKKPVASFTISGRLPSCTYPDTVQFNNTATDAVAFKWFFGDGDSSSEVNPVHIYGAGKFSPMLVAYNASGCTDTLIKTNAAFVGGAIINGFNNLPDSGCVPRPIAFSANIEAPESITSYLWNFGDGETATDQQSTHSYTAAGRYNVSLIVTIASGCITKYISAGAVAVGTRSAPDFTANKTTVCGSEKIQFEGTASGPVTSWYWKFSGNNGAFVQNPIYAYPDTGRKTVKLVVNNYGCLDSVVKKDFIVVIPTVASFKEQFDCSNRSSVAFIDKSVAPESWFWDFGDGNTYPEKNPPVHEYMAPGKYVISLTTTNGSCTSKYLDTVYIITDKPVFNFDPADGQICRRADIRLGVNNPSYVIDYLWDLNDGHTLFSDTSIEYSYFKAGTYYPSLIARYRNSCQDTVYSPNPIVVSGPTASLGSLLPAVCLHDSTAFIDKSFSDGRHNIVSRMWNYGDGTDWIVDNIAPYTHLFAASGTFRATMAIADDNGCVDTAHNNTVVNPLPQVFAGLDTFVCERGNVELTPAGALSYRWEKDPTLSCTSCISPTASPMEDAYYMVTGTDASSCRASDTVQVIVVHPFALQVDDLPRDICAAGSVQLNASGADLYNWSPAAGLSNVAISNPVASPAATTTFFVTGTDSKQCFSQMDSVLVNVHANPTVTIVNEEIAAEKESRNLIITTGSGDIVKWNWYPAFGLSCADCPQPILEVQKETIYSAVVYSGFGCTDTAQLTVHVLCNASKIYIPSAFTPNGDGKNERFYIISSIDNPVRSFVIYNRAGELLFSKKSNSTNYPGDGWDGKYRGIPVPTGTYVYRVEVLCNGIVVPFTGTVTLLR